MVRRLVKAFRDDDDPLLIEEIKCLGAEVKQIQRELIEARKTEKLDQYNNRQTVTERIEEAFSQMSSDDPDTRFLARAKIAQEYRRTIQRLILYEDRIFLWEMRDDSGNITQYHIHPLGLLNSRPELPGTEWASWSIDHHLHNRC